VSAFRIAVRVEELFPQRRTDGGRGGVEVQSEEEEDGDEEGLKAGDEF
jgi:hypothetical protein